jgi:hypothetical protein
VDKPQNRSDLQSNDLFRGNHQSGRLLIVSSDSRTHFRIAVADYVRVGERPDSCQ